MGILKLLQPTLAARIDLEAAAFVFVQSMIWLGSHAHYIMPCIFVLWLAYCVVEKRRLNVSPKPKAMKTKTTLAALLLAAVMVTPSYGADEPILRGAEDVLNNRDTHDGFFFTGYVIGVVQRDQFLVSHPIFTIPDGAKAFQPVWVVAEYIHDHPGKHHASNVNLIAEAIRNTWPMESKRSSK